MGTDTNIQRNLLQEGYVQRRATHPTTIDPQLLSTFQDMYATMTEFMQAHSPAEIAAVKQRMFRTSVPTHSSVQRGMLSISKYVRSMFQQNMDYFFWKLTWREK